MFSKSCLISALLIISAAVSSVNAHITVQPALGIPNGQAIRKDAQRPSAASPCGTVNVATNLDTSDTAQLQDDGTFQVNVTNFNLKADGSTFLTAEVDPTGTGTPDSFEPATMVTNGDKAPSTKSSISLTVQLPPGTKCNGGANKNLCLVSFTSPRPFGNCVVVKQGANGASASAVAQSASKTAKVVGATGKASVTKTTKAAKATKTGAGGGAAKAGALAKAAKASISSLVSEASAAAAAAAETSIAIAILSKEGGLPSIMNEAASVAIAQAFADSLREAAPTATPKKA